MSQDQHNANSADGELHKLLRETTGASPNLSRRELRSTQAPTGPSLHELLRASGGVVDKGPSIRRAPAAEQPKAELQLDQVLRQVHGKPAAAEAPRRKAPIPQLAATADLGQALGNNRITPAPVEPETTGLGFNASPWFARAGQVTAALLVIGVALWWPSRQLAGPAGTLQSLARAVEQYRSNNGNLPQQLAKLEVFPKDAVEWPVQYWNARDAVGRTEIIWVPQGSRHYRIVLRQGAESWIYSDREGKSRLTAKGEK